jgi:hypothetical protein
MGLQEGMEFAALTDTIYKTWVEKSAKEYKKFKGKKNKDKLLTHWLAD